MISCEGKNLWNVFAKRLQRNQYKFINSIEKVNRKLISFEKMAVYTRWQSNRLPCCCRTVKPAYSDKGDHTSDQHKQYLLQQTKLPLELQGYYLWMSLHDDGRPGRLKILTMVKADWMEIPRVVLRILHRPHKGRIVVPSIQLTVPISMRFNHPDHLPDDQGKTWHMGGGGQRQSYTLRWCCNDSKHNE